MATYDLVFNIAKGRVVELAALAASNSAFIAVPIETSGIVAASFMRDYTSLNSLLAGASNEQTSNMGRKILASVVAVVDQTNDRVDVDAADVTWTAATGNPISAVTLCYDVDTTTGTDSSVVPLLILDAVVTPAGGDITLQFATAGFFRAS